ATYSREIEQLAHKLLDNPLQINVAPKNAAAETVTQFVVHVEKRQKRHLLAWLINSNNWYQVLVFTRTKHGANKLSKQLTSDGLEAAAIHGNKSQNARTQALAGFKAGKIRVLVATDIAARGIDIDQLPHVINYELPNVPEDYVHRIGRTGRAGMEGEAIALVDSEERKLLRDIQRLIGRDIPELDTSAYQPVDLPPVQEQGERRRPPRRKPQGNRPKSNSSSGNRAANSNSGGEGKPKPRRRKPRSGGKRRGSPSNNAGRGRN
ncbi:MAG: helicase-related protein, partial [Salinisphaeraceae bacterium]|nr:helicase-related protein [Salinisphaeraceae bacterium]